MTRGRYQRRADHRPRDPRLRGGEHPPLHQRFARTHENYLVRALVFFFRSVTISCLFFRAAKLKRLKKAFRYRRLRSQSRSGWKRWQVVVPRPLRISIMIRERLCAIGGGLDYPCNVLHPGLSRLYGPEPFDPLPIILLYLFFEKSFLCPPALSGELRCYLSRPGLIAAAEGSAALVYQMQTIYIHPGASWLCLNSAEKASAPRSPRR